MQRALAAGCFILLGLCLFLCLGCETVEPFLKKGDFDGAEAYCEKNPSSQCSRRLAEVFLQQERYGKAYNQLRLAGESVESACVTLGNILESRGQAREAAAYFDRAGQEQKAARLYVKVAQDELETLNKQHPFASQITGGCQASMGELSQKNARQLADIVHAATPGQELKILSDLGLLLNKDPDIKKSARPLIQGLLVMAAQSHGLTLTTQNERYYDWAASALKTYTTSDAMYPEYSYEASLCRELQLIVVRAKIERIIQDEKSRLAAEDPSKAPEENPGFRETAKRLRSYIAQAADAGLSDLWKRPVDLCAKKQLWEYATRLMAGGPYWKHNGIETNAALMKSLKEARDKETVPEILEIAQAVFKKAK